MDKAFDAVTEAWHNLVIPPEPEDPTDVNGMLDYVVKLKESISSLAEAANRHEYCAQKLSEANMRQVAIIGKLREQIQDMKVAQLKAATEYISEPQAWVTVSKLRGV